MRSECNSNSDISCWCLRPYISYDIAVPGARVRSFFLVPNTDHQVMTEWMDSTTSSTRRTKEAQFRSPVPSVVSVCPAECSAPAEWFLYDICSVGRQHSGAAVRLCAWLAVQLRGWLRSLTGSLVMTHIINYDVSHGTFDDVTFHIPETIRVLVYQQSPRVSRPHLPCRSPPPGAPSATDWAFALVPASMKIFYRCCSALYTTASRFLTAPCQDSFGPAN